MRTAALSARHDTPPARPKAGEVTWAHPALRRRLPVSRAASGPPSARAAVAIGAHLLGGGLLLAHRERIRNQPGVGANTAIKAALTVAAPGTTAYSGLLGAKLSRAAGVETAGGAVPAGTTAAPGQLICRGHRDAEQARVQVRPSGVHHGRPRSRAGTAGRSGQPVAAAEASRRARLCGGEGR